MIIWRGWGILAVIYAGAAAALFGGLGSTFLPYAAVPVSIAIGMIGAAIATWYTGQALNGTGAQRKIDAWAKARSEQLHELVETGRFSLGPGQPQPQSVEEARQQSAWLFEQETQQAQRARNQHTLFFIPLQYWAFVIAAVAVFAAISGVIRLAA
ncbi:hypothetical protein ACTJJ4_16075 [Microbacterium sp. 22195]|uniref:hypothetical protein n=1 Tax=Microbacterium sp. 22195 TaxID=3453891 RepID=UPI003F83066C